jgi:uncharacterized protein YxeA
MKSILKLFFALIIILNSNSIFAQKIVTTEKNQQIAQQKANKETQKSQDEHLKKIRNPIRHRIGFFVSRGIISYK